MIHQTVTLRPTVKAGKGVRITANAGGERGTSLFSVSASYNSHAVHTGVSLRMLRDCC